MAKIQASSNEKTVSLRAFLGLNESPDGDNKLKLGEATVCRNFKITDEGNLKKRAGTVLKYTLGTDTPIKGLWHGWCTHHELMLAACDNKLWMLKDNVFRNYAVEIGTINTTNDVFMFGFDEKVFIMDGSNYFKIEFDDTPVASTAAISATIATGNTGTSTLSSPTIVKATFENKITDTGVYNFWLGDNGWTLGMFTAVDLTDYGISYSGTAYVGDKLTVNYSAALDGTWVLSNLTDSTAINYGESYRPLIATNVPSAGGGSLLEEVNKLNGRRRVWINGDGSSKTFTLPETFNTVDKVTNLGTQSAVTGYSHTSGTNSITFTLAPPSGENVYEIQYSVSTNFASSIGAMRYAELYAGTQDNRVFVYGDGTNRTFYSGIDYDGHPRGDYFPDLYEITVGDTNTPITALIRHYSKMLAFKPEQTYSIDYGVVTLADGLLTPAFYSTPVNKIIGNEPMGQVQLVLNAPISLCKGNMYEWRNGSTYSANISVDERQAKRISDRISATLRGMDLSAVHCYDDNLNSEYYVIDSEGNCLVHNYRVDAWYYYTGLNARMIISVEGVPYIGTHDGRILMMDSSEMSDMGLPIDCYWESGSLDLGAPNMRKYISQLWVSIKAEEKNKVVVTSKTERSIENAEVEVEPDYENYMPRTTRCKIKTKKFVYYKLCFMTNEANTRCTVVDTVIKVRYTSQAK